MKTERLRTKFIRMYRLEKLLLNRNMTVPEMAEELEVNRRTIYRDLELIDELGIPLYKDDGWNSGYRILDTHQVPSYRSIIINRNYAPAEPTRFIDGAADYQSGGDGRTLEQAVWP